MLRAAQRTRLWVCVAFAIVIPIAPGIDFDLRIVLSVVVLSYALLSLGTEVLDARRGTNHARWVNPALGAATVFAVLLARPSLFTVGVVFLTLIVAFHASLNGLRNGVATALLAAVTVIVIELTAPPEDEVGWFTVVMIALMLPSLAVIVAGLTGERRHTAEQLARLHEALSAVRASPDLVGTLESVSDSIAAATDAEIAGVMLHEGDYLATTAKGALRARLTADQVEEYTRRDLALGPRGPIGYAMTHREVVVIADIDADERFSPWSTPWADALRLAGCASVVVVPLHLGAEVIGVLAAAFVWKGGLADEDITFLEAYAEQASAVLALARAYERERLVALDRAEADRLKTEFLSVVSHELRTPLTAVKGFVDTLLLHWDRLPDERRRELLERASANGDELARLVGQLLDFARIDADRIEVRPERLELARAVATVAEDLAPVLARHDLVVDLPPGLAAIADADAFEHVLVNLLTNAVKFSPRGSRIVVSGRPDGPHVVVSVADEGVGIAPADQDRIFERFYQADGNELSRRGTGIGLTIARRFTEIHGGRLWVESTPGAGSVFSFTLPAGRTPDSGVVVEPGARLATEAAGGDQVP